MLIPSCFPFAYFAYFAVKNQLSSTNTAAALLTSHKGTQRSQGKKTSAYFVFFRGNTISQPKPAPPLRLLPGPSERRGRIVPCGLGKTCGGIGRTINRITESRTG